MGEWTSSCKTTDGSGATLRRYTVDEMAEETERESAEDRPVPPPVDPPRRCGPLAVEHHRKADGRLLILYKWVGEDG